jgi:membrane peptidoglycan carboxypeptidase
MKQSRRGNKALSVYSNLSNRRRANKEARARRKAEYLATLPKHPVKRFFYRIHPRRFFTYWFSRQGAIMAAKIAGVGALLLVLMFGVLFAYYRRELDAIRPSELAKRVQTTVTKYYDRNGVLLWEDKGDGDYKLVVESKDISKYMKDATVAIEDKDFYKHGGFSFTGILRAVVSNSQGGSTQGGSTLTQQLVKQVFLADEAQNRGISGIPRKIKELILSVEVERMYNKDQILTLYLNESPYGGRRNGVESAAQTYFGKPAKDLTLAESALLASIPQSPGYYDPYTTDPEARKDLVTRSHTTLNYMVDQGLVSKNEAETAKKVSVLDTIKPEQNQFAGIKAPHFVQMVKAQLENELGKKTVGEGGLSIKTTLDWRVQDTVDKAIEGLFASSLPRTAGFDNGAATVIDVPTGQILALRGSRDYNYPDYGADNAANAFIQPGSSIKPFVYSALFEQKQGTNYGAGTILSDSPLPQNIYRTDDGTSVMNFDNKFRGNIPIRSGLAESRNIPAIKAMYLNDQVNGNGSTVKAIQRLGDKSYCTDGRDKQVGLAASIGGCGLKQIEHANTFATLGRMGVYKPPASVLEVKNSQGQIIKQWKDESKKVLDPQVSYIISDILSDDGARSPSFGRGASGLNVPGVKTATKTGTSNLGTKSKDLWMNSYSPRAALSIWVGNHVPKSMNNALSSIVGPTVNNIMGPIHKDIFAKDGSWKTGDWFTQPAGIQRLSVSGRSDLFPSWYNKNQNQNATEKITFDKVSKKKATDCTPEGAKVTMDVSKSTDPITRQTVYLSSDGYDASKDDDFHKCDDVKPFVNLIDVKSGGSKLIANVTRGTHGLQSVEFKIAGQVVGTATANESGEYSITVSGSFDNLQTISVTVVDAGYYTAESSRTYDFH